MQFQDIFTGVAGNFVYDFFKKVFTRSAPGYNQSVANDDTVIIHIESPKLENNNGCENILTKTISERFQYVLMMMNQGFSTEI